MAHFLKVGLQMDQMGRVSPGHFKVLKVAGQFLGHLQSMAGLGLSIDTSFQLAIACAPPVRGDLLCPPWPQRCPGHTLPGALGLGKLFWAWPLLLSLCPAGLFLGKAFSDFPSSLTLSHNAFLGTALAHLLPEPPHRK